MASQRVVERLYALSMALLRAEAVNEALQPHAEELLSSGQLDDTILDQLVQAVRSLEQTPLLRAGNLLMVYLGLLYSVVEAWRKWRFTDARVDAMLKSPYVSELGDFRDAVFHVVPATDARLLAWEAAPTRVQWANDLAAALRTAILDWQGNLGSRLVAHPDVGRT